ncbi:MAG: glutathione peroxidase [bacterium]|nr:glutathione peroxidase [bacterium]
MRALAKIVCLVIGVAGYGTVAAGDDTAKNEAKPGGKSAKSVLDFKVKDIDGRDVELSRYAGRVLLIVNVASECGLTDRNYRKLQPLHEEYHKQGLAILAFPANNFGSQEPGTNEQIKKFCSTRYQVGFDLFAKVSVVGQDKCPLYAYLTERTDEQVRGKVEWNFQKYLVGRDGSVLAKFHPRVDPDDPKLVDAVKKALAEPKPGKKGEATTP